jgi:hypothetical protein
MIIDSETCPHLEVAVMDGGNGVTFVECGACHRQFERAPDSPEAYSLAGVAALVGGTDRDWQYIGLWRHGPAERLHGLDHYRRRPARVPDRL